MTTTTTTLKHAHNTITAQEDADRVRIYFLDANEPGRSACMSSDECGAYLTHITRYYDDLTDGMIFMQVCARALLCSVFFSVTCP